MEENNAPREGNEGAQRLSAEGTWDDMCAIYETYVRDNGGIKVGIPTTNQRLYNWVKNQRNHYQEYLHGKPTRLTIERITKLNDIGFVWQVKKTWEERFSELQNYYTTHGNIMVSRTDSSTKMLGDFGKGSKIALGAFLICEQRNVEQSPSTNNTKEINCRRNAIS
jgi:hypothetical protein